MAKILIAGAGGAPSEGVIYSLKKITWLYRESMIY